jgi:hypothetical protein
LFLGIAGSPRIVGQHIEASPVKGVLALPSGRY